MYKFDAYNTEAQRARRESLLKIERIVKMNILPIIIRYPAEYSHTHTDS